MRHKLLVPRIIMYITLQAGVTANVVLLKFKTGDHTNFKWPPRIGFVSYPQ